MEKDNSVRKQKLESLLQGIISRFFTLHSADWGIKGMVLVDQVFVAADLRSAQVWVSFSPHEPAVAEKLFEKVIGHMRELQAFVFEQMQVRRVPRLSLHLSDPSKTFRMMDIFDTLDSHAKPSQSDTPDTTGEQSDTAGNA